jgi:nucleotide-binding universal stress UspA family protein
MVVPVVRRILAPVELAETREPELGYAIGLAAQLRAELILLAVIDTPATVNLIGRHRAMASGGRDFDKALHLEVQGMLQHMVDKAAEAGVRALGHLTFSEDVEEQILKEALVQRDGRDAERLTRQRLAAAAPGQQQRARGDGESRRWHADQRRGV